MRDLSSESKLSRQKARRLEKYIDKKLKKEERLILFEKLSKSQVLSDPTNLQPSSSLGSGKGAARKKRAAKNKLIDNVDNKGSDASPLSHRGVNDVDYQSDTSVNEVAGYSKRVRPPKNAAVFEEWTGFSHPDHNEQPDPLLQEGSGETANELWESSDSDVIYPKRKRRRKSMTPSLEWTGFSHNEDDKHPDALAQDDRNASADERSESSESDVSDHPKRRRRRNAIGFKEWAMRQLEAAKSHEPPPMEDASQPPSTTAPLVVMSSFLVPKPQDPIRGPLGEVLALPSTSFAEHIRTQTKDPNGAPCASAAQHVNVKRSAEIQEARLLLPIVTEEQPIMEAVLLNPVVIICGETGSGKTTQIPQFLYEAGFGCPDGDNPGMIGITQPRRVAAMSMAARVALELSLHPSRVSYQIRYDATVSPMTTIKFMTDGVLLRELAIDFLLTRYSVVVVDEAHERSMNTDILIGVLSRVVRLREEMWKEGNKDVKPLRLIIMSATLRVSDFTSNTTLFRTPPPVINIAARQHPVTIHFNRRTASDYVTEAVRKTIKIHTRLPPGGILVFLTGQNEITGVCKKLEARFGRSAIRAKKAHRRDGTSLKSVRQRVEEETQGEGNPTLVPTQVDIEAEDIELGGNVENNLAMDVDGDVDSHPAVDALDSDSEALDEPSLIDIDDSDTPMHIVPLYSLLSSEKQMKVFQTPPSDTRLIVVATNVAETSLTIPDIRYVVDCGRAKERKYDVQSGIQSFQVSWISKASAAQRAGRAGRTGPGHCYRLYSSALFENHFDQFAQPEILRVPIEGVVLQMKAMNIDAVVNFPFPTSPERTSLKHAETILGHLGALEGAMQGSHVTDLGRTMALFPVTPRFSKMLVSARQHSCLPYIVAIVAALSVGDPFLRAEALAGTNDELDGEHLSPDTIPELSQIRSPEIKAKEVARAQRRAFFNSQQACSHGSLGDGTSDVFRLLSIVGAYEYAGGGHAFCAEHYIRPKAMEEIHKLRVQISRIVATNFPDVAKEFTPKIQPPNDMQLKILRQILTAGFIDQVAVRKDRVDQSIRTGNKFASSRGVPYKALGVSEDVFIHPSSILFHVPPPEYVVFHEIIRTYQPWIKTVTIINSAWLPKLGPTLCSMSKPLKSAGGEAIVIPRFGPNLWELPPIKQAA